MDFARCCSSHRNRIWCGLQVVEQLVLAIHIGSVSMSFIRYRSRCLPVCIGSQSSVSLGCVGHSNSFSDLYRFSGSIWVCLVCIHGILVGFQGFTGHRRMCFGRLQ